MAGGIRHLFKTSHWKHEVQQERWAGTPKLWRRHQAVMFHQRKSRLARLIDYIDGVRTCCWLLVHSLYC